MIELYSILVAACFTVAALLGALNWVLRLLLAVLVTLQELIDQVGRLRDSLRTLTGSGQADADATQLSTPPPSRGMST